LKTEVLAVTFAIALGMLAVPLAERLVNSERTSGKIGNGVATGLACGGMLLLTLHAVLLLPGSILPFAILLAFILTTITIADIRSLLIPDALSLPLLSSGLGVAAWLSPDGDMVMTLAAHCLAAAGGFLVIWLLAEYWRRVRGVEGIGMGDAKLLAATGAWVGPALLPMALLIACLSGLAVGLSYSLAVRGRADTHVVIPFGPFISLGLWLAFIHG